MAAWQFYFFFHWQLNVLQTKTPKVAQSIFPIDRNQKEMPVKPLTGRLRPETWFISNLSNVDFSVMVF